MEQRLTRNNKKQLNSSRLRSSAKSATQPRQGLKPYCPGTARVLGMGQLTSPAVYYSRATYRDILPANRFG